MTLLEISRTQRNVFQHRSRELGAHHGSDLGVMPVEKLDQRTVAAQLQKRATRYKPGSHAAVEFDDERHPVVAGVLRFLDAEVLGHRSPFAGILP